MHYILVAKRNDKIQTLGPIEVVKEVAQLAAFQILQSLNYGSVVIMRSHTCSGDFRHYLTISRDKHAQRPK